ncbi:hypothetical protein DFH08DRAFT_906039 [Mycena albidolilacea]|uniref:F-box domain-containing protein n=1 Tax=Mycena albidolilacea TaxID=1033008 RepID=A0AAD6YYY0_9AGAR|nr:hypothetical protein DFH08DRAFT_906039 [Mycena albidolilacea]
MSAQQLRTRIEELSSEIALQKRLLKKLQQDKSVALGQLNAVMDPVARLPLEISSEIFLQCLVPNCTPTQGDPSPRPMAGARHLPMLLLNVSNAWRFIAISTPALWSAMQIAFPCAQRLTRLLPIWFQRARTRPLSILLRGELVNFLKDPIFTTIWRHGGQIEHLEIRDDESDDEHNSSVIEIFGYGTTLYPLPLLKTLIIGTWNRQDRVFCGPEIIQLLRLSPNIVECFFGGMEFSCMLPPVATKKLVLRTLRRLTFGDPTCRPENNDVLDCLTLPALEALHAAAGDELLGLLKRSSPPLQELCVGVKDYPCSLMQECLQIIPTLVRFTIWEGSEHMTELFAALTNSSSLLPNLRSLTIHARSRDIPDSAWRTLLRAVLSRRIQLRILDVKVPPAEVLAAFREAIVDGAEVYIGTEECNFMNSPSLN